MKTQSPTIKTNTDEQTKVSTKPQSTSDNATFTNKAPAEIAKETLKTLASAQLPPTDENYARIYESLAGTEERVLLPKNALQQHLQQSADSLIMGQIKKNQWLQALGSAFSQKKYSAIVEHIQSLLMLGTQKVNSLEQSILEKEKSIESLRHKIHEIYTQNPLQNTDSPIDHNPNSNNDDSKHAFISHLNPLRDAVPQNQSTQTTAGTPVHTASTYSEAQIETLKTLCSTTAAQSLHMIDNALVAFEDSSSGFQKYSALLRKDLAEISKDPFAALNSLTNNSFKSNFANFNHQLSFCAEDQNETQSALLALLNLVFEHLNTIAFDDPWIESQIAVLTHATTAPISLRKLDQAHTKLKDLVIKQSILVQNMRQHQQELQKMLALFIQRLSEMAHSSSEQHLIIEQCAQKIANANKLSDLTTVVQTLLGSARTLSTSTQNMHQELQQLKDQVQQHQQQIAILEQELETSSTAARHDSLTGALNRKGLDEALTKECARALRTGSSLCVAVLDIDDFKKINDSLGHDTGDATIKNLAQIAREHLRPHDTLARYGGEEFIIILPDTDLDGAQQALTRLQRALTKTLFVHKNNKIIYTFSAGVTQFDPNKDISNAIEKADQNMYIAKRAGKNRVVAG